MTSPLRTFALTGLALLAFAGNSLLCRAALAHTAIDAASFTAIRMASGALALTAFLAWRHGAVKPGGNTLSALALFAYAIAFSLSYLYLSAATGALILFASVQATMIGTGLARGERLRALQVAGLALALGGLVALLLPGLAAPPLAGALLMIAAGAAWGVYSLRGKSASDPLATTAGNFARTVPMALAVLAFALIAGRVHWDVEGAIFAALSGALTSGAGYVVWYAALPFLSATTAASVQLSVPVIATLGGVLMLGESPTLRLVLCSAAILGGIALVVLRRK